MMRVLIAEDEEIYASTLQIMFEEMEYDAIEIVNNSDSLFKILPTFQPDLLILDIHIEGNLDGIQIAEKVHQMNAYIPIIFITSFKDNETFQRAKSTKPYAFLTKPFDEKVLANTIELAFQYYKTQISLLTPIKMPDSLFIKTDNLLKKIHFEEIGYIESEDHYVQIVTAKRKYLIRHSLNEMIQKLPADIFFQVSRSCLVNLQHIDSVDIDNNELLIFQHPLAFSRRNKQDILEKIMVNKL